MAEQLLADKWFNGLSRKDVNDLINKESSFETNNIAEDLALENSDKPLLKDLVKRKIDILKLKNRGIISAPLEKETLALCTWKDLIDIVCASSPEELTEQIIKSILINKDALRYIYSKNAFNEKMREEFGIEWKLISSNKFLNKMSLYYFRVIDQETGQIKKVKISRFINENFHAYDY